MEALTRIYVPLDENERKALIQYALAQKRDPHRQAALLIRQQLEHLGEIQPVPKETANGKK